MQFKLDEKSNEITAILKLLYMLIINGINKAIWDYILNFDLEKNMYFCSRNILNMNTYRFSTKEKTQESDDTLLEESRNYDIVLFNDDVNTFDWVIKSLIEVCNHEQLQAEQSAYIVHYKGKCAVKSGSWEDLVPVHRELSNRDLSVEVV